MLSGVKRPELVPAAPAAWNMYPYHNRSHSVLVTSLSRGIETTVINSVKIIHSATIVKAVLGVHLLTSLCCPICIHPSLYHVVVIVFVN